MKEYFHFTMMQQSLTFETSALFAICQTFVTLGSLVCILEANLSPYLWKFLNQASATLGLGRGNRNSCNFDRLTFLMMFGLHSLLLIFAFVEILTFSDVLSDREYLLSAATPRCFFKDHFSPCQETRCIKPDTSSQKFRHHHPWKKNFLRWKL